MNDQKLSILFGGYTSGGSALIEAALNKAAERVETAYSPDLSEALTRIGKEQFDLFFLNAAGANGGCPEILSKIGENGVHAPLVIATCVHDHDTGALLVRQGAYDYTVGGRLDPAAMVRSIRLLAERKAFKTALAESDARYARLLRSVTDYTYTVSLENGRPGVSFHSPGCVAVTGYMPEDYCADSSLWFRMIHDEDRDAVLRMASELIEGRTPPPLEHRIIHKDGSTRWIRNTTMPRHNQQGLLVAYDGLVTDISDRKKAKEELLRANKALRESEEQLKGELANRTRAKKEWEVTFDAISNPLFIHDREWRIMRANRAYCAAAGVPFPELIGKPYYTIFPKMDAPSKNCVRAIAGETQTSSFTDEEIVVPEMNKVFRTRLYPVHDDNGEYLFSVHILEDITEMKRAEEHIKQEMELTANLLMIAETTATTMDIDTLMHQVARCGSSVLGCDACVTYLWDRERKAFQAAQHHGLGHELVPLFRTETLDEKFGFVQRMLELKKPIMLRSSMTGEAGCATTLASPFMTDGKADDAPLATRTALWMNDNMRVLVVIPLIGKTDPLGLIITAYRSFKTFTERDQKIVEGLSRQVSLALDEAHSYRTAMERSLELNHKIETLQVIHEIDRGILSSLEPHEILETAIRNISRIVPCDNADVMLVDREKGGFIRPAGAETSPSLYKPLVPFCDSSAAEVIKTGRPQYTGNTKGQRNLLPMEQELLEKGFVSHIRIPLIVKGDPIGVLCVDSKRTAVFTPENLSTLEKLAALIGVALENTRLVTDLKELLLGTVRSLSNAIDAKSPWTAGHSERVTHYALLIGKELNFLHDDLQDMQLGCLLHDVGKIGILDTILNKTGTLTPDEYAVVKSHPLWGVGLLEPIKQLNRVIPCIRHHHERYDGSGYPDGLKGENIPIWARILAVADTFDAMTADRPYRKAFEQGKAVAEIKRCTPNQFDPTVVKAFLDILARNHASDRRQAPPLPPKAVLHEWNGFV